MDRQTGKAINGNDHLLQSLDCLFTTRKGTRVMRREIGIDLDIVDVPINSGLAGLWVYALSEALESSKETRFEISEGKINLVDKEGNISLQVFGDNQEMGGKIDVVTRKPHE